MARSARHKSTEAAFYHLTNRVAGRTDWFPFKNDQARRKLLDMMLFYVNVYRCRLAAFEIMGNHFHFVVHFEKPRKVPDKGTVCFPGRSSTSPYPNRRRSRS